MNKRIIIANIPSGNFKYHLDVLKFKFIKTIISKIGINISIFESIPSLNEMNYNDMLNFKKKLQEYNISFSNLDLDNFDIYFSDKLIAKFEKIQFLNFIDSKSESNKFQIKFLISSHF